MELVYKLFTLAQSLAKSQGFYGRLLEQLQKMDIPSLENLENVMEQEIGLQATDIDIILWLEG